MFIALQRTIGKSGLILDPWHGRHVIFWRFNESNVLKYQKSIKIEMLSVVYICNGLNNENIIAYTLLQGYMEDSWISVLMIWQRWLEQHVWEHRNFMELTWKTIEFEFSEWSKNSKTKMAGTARWKLLHMAYNTQTLNLFWVGRHLESQRRRWQEQQDGNWKWSTDSSTLFPLSTCTTVVIFPWSVFSKFSF